jgi:sugar O-acyltransferase (sialic acid O-acetyltransferase NeuD family)
LQKIAVYGAGGFGLEVVMLIEQINAVEPQWDIAGFFDDGVSEGTVVNDYPVIGGMDALNGYPSELYLVLALGWPQTKMKVCRQITNPNIHFPVLIHPSVIAGNPKYLSIGEGSIICAGSIITTNIDIGRHVIINLACTVGHETTIGDFSSFMPTCNISGEVKIGNATFWGTGAKIINQKTIGNGTVIGAGAVVTEDIPDHVTAIGVPAKVVKKHNGESDE